MIDKRMRLFTAASGIVTFGLYVTVAAMMAEAPRIDTDGSQALQWIRAHRQIMLFSTYLFGLCVSTTFFFLTGLWGILKSREGGSGTFSMIGLAGGYSIFTLALGGFVFALTAAYRADTLVPESAKLLSDLSLLSVALTGFPTAVSMIGFTVVLARERIFPAWLTAFSVAITIGHLVSGGAFAASGMLSPSGIGVYVMPVLYYVWILVVSVLLLRGSTVCA